MTNVWPEQSARQLSLPPWPTIHRNHGLRVMAQVPTACGVPDGVLRMAVTKEEMHYTFLSQEREGVLVLSRGGRYVIRFTVVTTGGGGGGVHPPCISCSVPRTPASPDIYLHLVCSRQMAG